MKKKKYASGAKRPQNVWASAPTTPYVVDSTRAGIPKLLRRFKKGDTVK
jgi:hypothetical protein